MSLINNLEWRYATKKFDTTKKVSSEDLLTIKRAIQLSASAYGLQLYKVKVIEDPALREQLKLASYGQVQITDASHLLVFCNYTEVKDSDIDEYIDLKADIQHLDANHLKGYADFMKGDMNSRSKENINHWTAKQTYIGLGNLLAACAELKIDACPMEGFEAHKYNDLLDLSDQGLNAAVIATIGYRSEADDAQHVAKVRRPLDQLFI